MISVLLYSHEKRELTLFSKTGLEVAGKISGDDWQFYGYRDCEAIYRFLCEHPLIDIKAILLSRSTLVLDYGSELPLSRSYKHIFKELK